MRVSLFFIVALYGVASLSAADNEHLAAYFQKRLAAEPALKTYVRQASDNPAGFAATVQKDLLEHFKQDPAVLNDELLLRYVNCETLSMHYIQSGNAGLSSEALQAVWADEELLPHFRMVPGLILCYNDTSAYTVGGLLLQHHPRSLDVFSHARHSQFHKIAAVYLNAVYRAYLFKDAVALRKQYLDQFAGWLVALRLQQVPPRLERESIALAVKLCSQLDDEAERKSEIRRLAALVLAAQEKEWQEYLVQACVQLDLDAYLDTAEKN